MSGRTRWQRDGQWITGHRKTDRRNPRRDPRERLRELAGAGPDAFPIRMAFGLPRTIVLAPGPHGIGVQVLAGGFVRIGSHSGDGCFMTARRLLAVVARERPAFTTTAVIINAAEPDKSYARFLTVINGVLVVSAGGLIEPRIFEAA